MPRRIGLGGLRVRAGNIQVGAANILESAFLEPRFNAWCVGELHIITDRILPNGRRDDFEINAHLQNFQGHAAALGTRLSRMCRESSIQRNRLRTANLLMQVAEEQLIVVRDASCPSMVRNHYRRLIEKTIVRLERMALDPKFQPSDQAAIEQKVRSLTAALGAAPASRISAKTLAFLPAKQRNVFLDTLKLAIAACDNPDQAARMARKVFERARRRKYG
jgi:molecular chaperone HtpG